MSRYGHDGGNAPGGAALPVGNHQGDGAGCKVRRKRKVKLADPPLQDADYDQHQLHCCDFAKDQLLTTDEYAEWLKLYEENCQTGTPSNPEKYRRYSRRLHLWRDGFTSDSTYQKWRAELVDRYKVMGALATFLSEFIGVFAAVFLPILIIAAVPTGEFDQWGAFGPAAFGLSAFVATAFTYLFMHGSYLEPTTTLLLYWFSDDFMVPKRRNFWPTLGRIAGQLLGAAVGCAILLIIWHRGSLRYHRVAQIVDIPTFVTSPDTDNDAVAAVQSYTVGESLLVVVLCTLIWELASFSIHVIARSTIRDYGTFNVIIPVLFSVAFFVTVWGQWNVTRSTSGIVRWLMTNAILVGHWAYGLTTAMQNSAWVIPIGALIAHILAVVFIYIFKWLYAYSGMIPRGYSSVRAAARARLSEIVSSDSDSSSSTDSD